MTAALSATRVASGGTNNTVDHSRLVMEGLNAGSPPTFQRAVVNDVIFNPKGLTNDQRAIIRSRVINPTIVDQMSANSIIATIISDGMSNAGPSMVVLQPMFQSHFMLPVMSGEQVIVMFSDFAKEGYTGGKWVCRVSEGYQVEDANFTHGDRRYQRGNYGQPRISESLNRTSGSHTPDFPNGAGASNSYSLPQTSEINPYQSIFETSPASQLHSYEVVPRWTKRPQEFVIQGMNNALIMLGQDRVGSVIDSARIEEVNYAGTIDIVTGRSRYLLLQTDQQIPQDQAIHKGTSPLIISNSRGLEEVDKTPKLNNRNELFREGDPDFVHDAARIYVSMSTWGDLNFKISNTTEGAVNDALKPSGINYSPKSLQPVQPVPSSREIGNSYIVNKADHLRLIARRTPPTEDSLDPIINGSILLVKEGKNRSPDDKNAASANTDHLAYLYMTPEGRVQIDGMQIFLGGAALRETNQYPAPDTPGNSEGSNSNVSVGTESQFAGAEPYIKFSEFVKVVEGLQRQIDDLHTAYSALVASIGNTTPTSRTVPFGPDSAWASLSSQANIHKSTLSANIRTHILQTNQAVYRSRSSKIFGQ